MRLSLFNKLVFNAASIFAARVFEGLLQLAVLAFILSRVGREYYAAALLIISVQATIDLARAGMQKATLKYIAEYEAGRDHVRANSILSSSSALQGFIGILGLLACLAMSFHTTELFALPLHMQTESQWAMIMLGFGLAISFFVSPWHSALAAHERYDLLSLANVSGRIFRALLIVALLSARAPSLISLVIAMIAGTLLDRFICLLFVRKINPNLAFRARDASSAGVKVIVRFSFFDFFHVLAGLLYTQGALYLAAHLISLDAIAGLGIIANITALIGLVMQEFAQMLVPVASRLQVQGEIEKLKMIVLRGTAVIVFAGGLVVVGLVPWMDDLLRVWLGPSFADLTAPAIVLVSAAFLMNSLTCIHKCLGGIGKVAVDGFSNAVCTILGLAIGVVLVTVFDLGLLGLAIGLLCARMFRFAFLSNYGASVFDVPLGHLLWRGCFRAYVLAAAIALTGMAIHMNPESWISLAAAVSISMSIYSVIGILWVIYPADRQRFGQIIDDGLARLGIRPPRRALR